MKKVGQLYREDLIRQIKHGLQKSNNIFLVTFSKISGPKMNDIRKSFRQKGARILVTRNSLARLALKEVKCETLTRNIEGQSVFIWSNSDSIEISKVLVKFTNDLSGLVIQGGILEGEFLDKDQVDQLAKLPSREGLLANLLGIMKSPINRLLGSLNAKTRDLLSILKKLSEKKGG